MRGCAIAYVFDQINNELDPNQKQNIFGQGATPQGASQTGAASGDEVKKTDTSGVIAAPGASSGTSGASGPATPEDRQKVVNLQSQRQQAPKITDKLKQDLTSAQTNLQDEANKYTQGYQQKDYREGVNQDLLSKAVQGDQTAYDQAYQRAFKQGPDAVTAFAPETQTEFQGVQDLQTTGGIKNMFKREQGPQYRDTEASFDTMLLARNPEFRKIQQALSRQQKDLIAEREKEKTDRTTGAEQIASEGFKSASEGIRTDLGGLQTNLENPLRQKEAEEDARRAALDYDAMEREYEAQQAAELEKEFYNQGGFMQRASGLLPKVAGDVDEKSFFTRNTDVDWRDFATDTDAQQFNRIMSLLAQNDSLRASTGLSDVLDKNTQGLRDALTQAAVTQRRGTEDQYRAQMQSIIDQMNARAAQSASLRGRDVGTFRDPAQEAVRREYDAMNLVQNILFPEAKNAVDAGQFYKKANQLSGLNLIDSGQAAELNRLAQETGQAANYAAGGPVQMEDQFDRGAYENALRQYINSRMGGSGGGQGPGDRENRMIDYWKDRAAAGEAWAGQALGKAADQGNEYAKTVRDDIAQGRYGDAVIDSVPGARQIANSVGGGGGKIICTAYTQIGWLPAHILAADLNYQRKYAEREHIANYLAWAQYVAPLVGKNILVRYLFWPLTRQWAYQMAYRMGVVDEAPLFGGFTENILLGASNLLGRFLRRRRKLKMQEAL